MRNDDNWSIRGIIGTQPLIAGVIIAFISLMSVVLIPSDGPLADMHIEPKDGVIREGEPLVVRVVVLADVPVNVFKGELQFDHTRLRVDSIDYNTGIADLWAEKPWYENGDGTINFIGGTTRTGGFLGTGELMTITFTPINLGPAVVSVLDARILAHDGLGSDVPLEEPIDALFTVDGAIIDNKTIATPTPSPTTIAVVREGAQTDLNGDGVQSITDMSIFMVGLVTGNRAHDFNGDGKVNLSDLSMLMSAK